jgi:hypothetical protein
MIQKIRVISGTLLHPRSSSLAMGASFGAGYRRRHSRDQQHACRFQRRILGF